jgi:two-component system OmpR family sensor kinase
VSLRRRLRLWYGALLAVVLALALTLAYIVHAEAHDSDVDAALNDMAGRATAEIDAQLTRGDPLTDVTLAGLHRVLDDPYAAWLVVGGHALVSAGAIDNTQLATLDVASVDDGWHTRWTEGGRIRTLSAPVASPAARLVLAVDLRQIDAANEQLRWAYLLLGLVAVGVGTAAMSELTGAALRPVSQITTTASEIASSRDFGRRVHVVGDPEDELVVLGDTFDAMLASLDDAYRQQQRFLGDVSHELRTPLTVIHGNAQLLAGGEGDLEEQRVAASHILRESERLTRLVDKLLVLARADTAEPFVGHPLQLDEIAMETFEDLRALGGGRLRVRWIDAVTVSGERDRLKQLLVVLIDNALRYTPAPGTVDLSVSDDGHEAVIRVEDQGIGLPNVPVAQLFERSYRGPGARALDPSGSGLGLSIARWIVLRHGGTIALEPNEGRGTRAVVRLPRVLVHLDE